MRTVHVLRLITALCASAVLWSASARDRPGTPFNLMVRQCADLNEKKPAVCLVFQNGAKEPVAFKMEWTRDGQPMPGRPTSIIDCDVGWRSVAHCNAMVHVIQGVPAPFKAGFHEWEGIAFRELEYGTRYCFRFLAVDDDGVWSAAWSSYACLTTPSPPPGPQAPAGVKAEFFAATDGRGSPAGPLPDRVLVEWAAPTDPRTRSWYLSVYGATQDQRETAALHYKDRFGRPSKTQMLVPVKGQADSFGRYRVEVCAINIAGRACAGAMTAMVKPPTRDAARATPAVTPAGALRPEPSPNSLVRPGSAVTPADGPRVEPRPRAKDLVPPR